MRIGEISTRSGLSRDTIRFYEKRKLIKAAPSNSLYNNYKFYSEKELHRLFFIKKAKRFGFTLKEVALLLQLADSNTGSCAMLKDKVEQKIADIDQQINKLNDQKKMIQHQMESAKSACATAEATAQCVVLSLD